MKHLKLYGRPYWSTLKDEEVLSVAHRMLFPFEVLPIDEDDVFAVFAARVGLEIGVGQASKRLATEAVRSHMRILDAVVDSNVMTTSPPEPILALAAARAMNDSQETLKILMETLLDKLILKGVVLDRGLLGALPSQLLLLWARDRASTNGPVETNPYTKLSTVQPLRLSEFLQTLLGKDLGVPKEQGKDCDRLLWEADYVWINFTHFCQLPLAIGEVTEFMLVDAWSTGAAFQCAGDQPVIDGFIVGYRGSLDEPFQSSCLVTIPWKVKTKSDAAEPGLAQSLTAPFIVPQNGASAGRYKPWHVVILLDLAASSSASRNEGPRCDLTCEGAVRPEGGGREAVWKSYAEMGESEGQRYCLAIIRYTDLGGVDTRFDILFRRALGCAEPEFLRCAEKMEEAKGRVILG